MKNNLKQIIFALIVLIVIGGAAFYIMNTKAPEIVKEAIPPYAYDGSEDAVVIDNGQLKMTMDPKTTEFSIEVEDSGKIWYSNPQDAVNDAMALDDQKSYLQSPLIMSYSITQGLETTYNSYAFSAQKRYL